MDPVTMSLPPLLPRRGGGFLSTQLVSFRGYRLTVGMLLVLLAVVAIIGVGLTYVGADYARKRRIAAMRRRIAASKRMGGLRRRRLYGKTAA